MYKPNIEISRPTVGGFFRTAKHYVWHVISGANYNSAQAICGMWIEKELPTFTRQYESSEWRHGVEFVESFPGIGRLCKLCARACARAQILQLKEQTSSQGSGV